jgi:hypothetical protein
VWNVAAAAANIIFSEAHERRDCAAQLRLTVSIHFVPSGSIFLSHSKTLSFPFAHAKQS